MPTDAHLSDLKTLADELRTEFAEPIELPEPSARLGLTERAGQPVRQFKHLHQMCLGHVEHLSLSGAIKLLALLDGYLSAAQSSATIGQYLYARTILEECAFINEVQRRLLEVARKPLGNWMPKGEEFFSLVVRFRFATGDKEKQKTMESHGFPQKLLKPVNVMTCVASLSTNPAVAHLAPLYDTLCDFVHHNGPSHYTTSVGFYIGKAASHFGSGGAILTNSAGPIARYQYPAPNKAAKAIEDTAEAILTAARTCRKLLNELPRSPFPPSQIKEMTGTELGMVYLGKVQKGSSLQ